MNSISMRFALVTVVVSLSVLGLVGTINYVFLKDELLKETTEKANLIADNSVNKIQSIIQKTRIISDNVKEHLLYSRFSEKSVETVLKTTLQKDSDFYGMAMAFEPNQIYEQPYCPYYYKKDSFIIQKDLAHNHYNYLKQEWYKRPKERKKMTWSEPYFDEGGGNVLMATLGNPIFQKGRFVGVLTIDLSLKKLQKIIASIRVLQSGYAILLSKNNKILVDSDARKIMTSYSKEITDYNRLIKENDQWLYYTHVKHTNLTLGLVFPHDELFASLRKISFILLLLGIVGSVALVVIMFVVSRKITRPLKKVTQLTHEISLGNFDKKLQLKNTHDEVYDLSCSIHRMQDAIKHYISDLTEATMQQQRIDSELDIARSIQMSMLPKKMQEDKNIAVDAVLKPAKAVGGDFYEFFYIDSEHLCFVIADVSGKGIPAAMFMAVAVSYIKAYSTSGHTPAEIVSRLNNTMAVNNDANLFVTLFLGILQVESGKLRYVNAGHNVPYVIASEQVKILPPSGNAVVGAFEGIEYAEEELVLQKGEKMFLYTDGVNEAFSKTEEAFGLKRLEHLLATEGKKSNTELLQKIEFAINDFTQGAEQSDDITMLVISR